MGYTGTLYVWDPGLISVSRRPGRRRTGSSLLAAAVLDRIDEIIAPGINLNPADASWQRLALESAARLR